MGAEVAGEGAIGIEFTGAVDITSEVDVGAELASRAISERDNELTEAPPRDKKKKDLALCEQGPCG